MGKNLITKFQYGKENKCLDDCDESQRKESRGRKEEKT